MLAAIEADLPTTGWFRVKGYRPLNPITYCLRVWRFWGWRFRVWGLRFRVRGLGCRDWGLGFRVGGLGPPGLKISLAVEEVVPEARGHRPKP